MNAACRSASTRPTGPNSFLLASRPRSPGSVRAASRPSSRSHISTIASACACTAASRRLCPAPSAAPIASHSASNASLIRCLRFDPLAIVGLQPGFDVGDGEAAAMDQLWRAAARPRPGAAPPAPTTRSAARSTGSAGRAPRRSGRRPAGRAGWPSRGARRPPPAPLGPPRRNPSQPGSDASDAWIAACTYCVTSVMLETAWASMAFASETSACPLPSVTCCISACASSSADWACCSAPRLSEALSFAASIPALTSSILAISSPGRAPARAGESIGPSADRRALPTPGGR